MSRRAPCAYNALAVLDPVLYFFIYAVIIPMFVGVGNLELSAFKTQNALKRAIMMKLWLRNYAGYSKDVIFFIFLKNYE